MQITIHLHPKYWAFLQKLYPEINSTGIVKTNPLLAAIVKAGSPVNDSSRTDARKVKVSARLFNEVEHTRLDCDQVVSELYGLHFFQWMDASDPAMDITERIKLFMAYLNLDEEMEQVDSLRRRLKYKRDRIPITRK